MKYKYYFGTYDSQFQLKYDHTEYTAGGTVVIPRGSYNIAPWELKHVMSYSETMQTSQSSTIPIANKPAECVQIIDTLGPTRTIAISGIRYDAEEQTSNLDFMLTQFNMESRVTCPYYPFSDKYNDKESEPVLKIGVEWLTSSIQMLLKGFVFIKSGTLEEDEDATTERIPTTINTERAYTEVMNVGLTAFNFSFDNDNPGVMNYSLTLVERSDMISGPAYKEYYLDVYRKSD